MARDMFVQRVDCLKRQPLGDKQVGSGLAWSVLLYFWSSECSTCYGLMRRSRRGQRCLYSYRQQQLANQTAALPPIVVKKNYYTEVKRNLRVPSALRFAGNIVLVLLHSFLETTWCNKMSNTMTLCSLVRSARVHITRMHRAVP